MGNLWINHSGAHNLYVTLSIHLILTKLRRPVVYSSMKDTPWKPLLAAAEPKATCSKKYQDNNVPSTDLSIVAMNNTRAQDTFITGKITLCPPTSCQHQQHLVVTNYSTVLRTSMQLHRQGCGSHTLQNPPCTWEIGVVGQSMPPKNAATKWPSNRVVR